MLSVYEEHGQNTFQLFPQHSSYCRRFIAHKAWYFFLVVQHTLFHVRVLNFWSPKSKRASHFLKIFLSTQCSSHLETVAVPIWKLYFSSCKKCWFFIISSSNDPQKIIISEIQMWRSKSHLSVFYLLFLMILHTLTALQVHIKQLQELTGDCHNTIICYFGCLHSYIPTSF